MKADSKVIKLILPSELRKQFKTLCCAEGSNMTEKIIQFIEGEIERSNMKV
mgnify:CR=1 FL=1